MEQGNYFLCNLNETNTLLKQAEEESRIILDEFKVFYTGDIGIRVYAVPHALGHASIAGDLTVNGEVCRTEDPIDLLFLDLNELMLKRLIELRGVFA